MTTQNRAPLTEGSRVSGTIVESLGDVKSGKYLIKVIQWGEGSSAYYPKEVLERDGAKAFPAGTHIYLDHPTLDEEWSQPERSVRKLGGRTTEAAYYEDGSLYAKVTFGRESIPIVEDFKDVIGMSIYAFGESEIGTIGDYTGPILTSFEASPFNSIDVVTVPGAGGSILEKLAESLSAFGEKTPNAALAEGTEKKGNPVAEKEILDAIDGLKLAIESLVTNKTESIKAEADAEAVESASKAKIDAYDASIQAIESADLLPSQVASLRESAKAGKDITADIVTAGKIAAEAKEAATKSVETGRLAETAKGEFKATAWENR